MSNSRHRPTVSEMARIIADLKADNARLRQQLETPPPAPRVALKLAAFRAHIKPERLRRWCIDGKVDAELVGHQWFVSETSLSNRMRSLAG